MQIALIGYAHPFGEGLYYGAERIIYYLALELRKRGHNVVIFSVKGCNLPGFEYVEIPKCWDDKVDLYYNAVKKYEQDKGIKFDMVHSFQASGYIDPRFRSEYNYCLEPFMSFGKNHPGHWAENIIAYSEKLNSLNGGDSTTRYFGIPDDFYSDWSEEGDYLVWIGRMDPGKGPDNAIEIAKRVGKRIILMGPSYHYPYFVDKCWPYIDGDKVIWLRAVNDGMKKRVFKKALAFINPIWEQYHEMFGITNIESLAHGVPIVGWNNAVQPSAIGYNGGEIIQNGKHGFIINHNMYSAEEREKAIQASVEAVRNIGSISRKDCRQLFLDRFTSKIMTDKCLKYYEIVQQRKKVYNVTKDIGGLGL